MYEFLSGMFVMGAVVSGTFFIKYWLVTRDRMFIGFATALWLLALQRILLLALNLRIDAEAGEKQVVLYTIRCIAFVLILLAIIDRSRRQGK